MLGQFVLNLFIAALWFVLKDDPNANSPILSLAF